MLCVKVKHEPPDEYNLINQDPSADNGTEHNPPRDCRVKKEPLEDYGVDEIAPSPNERVTRWDALSSTIASLQNIKVEIDTFKIELNEDEPDSDRVSEDRDWSNGGSVTSSDSDEASVSRTKEKSEAIDDEVANEHFFKLELVDDTDDFDIGLIRDKFKELEKDLGSINGLFRPMTKSDFGIVNKKFNCDKCALKTDSQLDFKAHLRLHEGLVPYQCESCTFTTACSLRLQRHVRLHTVGDNRTYNCDICQRTYVCKDSLVKHMKIHDVNGKFKCGDCSREFFTKWGLIYHSWAHTGEKPYKCNRCRAAFTRKKNLEIHVAKMHGNNSEQAQAILAKVKCEVCDKEFANRQNYLVHTRLHTNERPFKCQFCERSFRDQSNYNHHRKLHEHRHECRQCELCFPNIEQLDGHVCDLNVEKTFVCKHCSASFAGYRAFRRHAVGHRHNGDHTEIHCDQCDKVFTTKSGHKQHYRLHTGDEPYKCEICHMGFRSASYRSRHVSKAHLNSPAQRRRYRCRYCRKGFYEEYMLNQHLTIHTGKEPYLCRKCGDGFERVAQLRGHRCR